RTPTRTRSLLGGNVPRGISKNRSEYPRNSGKRAPDDRHPCSVGRTAHAAQDPYHAPNLKLSPPVRSFSLNFTMEPAAPPQFPTVVQVASGRSTKRYSTLTVQLGAKAISSPAPTVQPVSVLLSKVDGGIRPV